jgi:predicted nucleotide-binding protein
MTKIGNNSTKASSDPAVPKKKRAYVSQRDIPLLSLEGALRLAEALNDNFAAKPTAPHQLAVALEISPTSSNWKDICGASIAYGLTSGGYNAKDISLTELGKCIVAPTDENEDKVAKVEAALLPRIAKQFFERYNRAKFPQDRIAKNVLAEMGVPPDRLDRALDILKENGMSVGLIVETKTGPFVAKEPPVHKKQPRLESESIEEKEIPKVIAEEEQLVSSNIPDLGKEQKNRVFIAHGKNTEIVSQLKKILVFGKFEPVVAVEHETTARSVPKKVVADMRTCFAGILHLSSEEDLLDREGKVYHRLNENVLIEIGAAMALYGDNFILLVEKGVHVPSNLQGLQRCEYEGDKLDVDATMKLLAAFNDFI